MFICFCGMIFSGMWICRYRVVFPSLNISDVNSLANVLVDFSEGRVSEDFVLETISRLKEKASSVEKEVLRRIENCVKRREKYYAEYLAHLLNMARTCVHYEDYDVFIRAVGAIRDVVAALEAALSGEDVEWELSSAREDFKQFVEPSLNEDIGRKLSSLLDYLCENHNRLSESEFKEIVGVVVGVLLSARDELINVLKLDRDYLRLQDAICESVLLAKKALDKNVPREVLVRVIERIFEKYGI